MSCPLAAASRESAFMLPTSIAGQPRSVPALIGTIMCPYLDWMRADSLNAGLRTTRIVSATAPARATSRPIGPSSRSVLIGAESPSTVRSLPVTPLVIRLPRWMGANPDCVLPDEPPPGCSWSG
jgi:hypothetical protein